LPAFVLVETGFRLVELRGFESLTFSLRDDRRHVSPDLGRTRRNLPWPGPTADIGVVVSHDLTRAARMLLEFLGPIPRSKRGAAERHVQASTRSDYKTQRKGIA